MDKTKKNCRTVALFAEQLAVNEEQAKNCCRILKKLSSSENLVF